MLMADALREKGYRVIEAASGDEASDILLSGQAIDLVVTDVRMPGQIDGLALTAHAKQLNPVRPVIVVSGHLEQEAAVGADLFIAKPYGASMLLRSIAKIIGGPWSNPPQKQHAS
jgi:CheY-like chemotaxis protein